MLNHKLTGSEAGVLKYDLITALTVAGLNGSATMQTSFMRLIALITARYNWRTDEFSVGQRDIARMWSVNERTVKREMKRLTQTGVLLCKRTGVRGRVGAYSLNYRRIAELSEPSWHLVGSDYDARMRERYASSQAKVVSLRPTPLSRSSDTAIPETGTWNAVMAHLMNEQPDLFKAWFSRLVFKSYSERVLQVQVPSVFIQRYLETHHLPLLINAVEAKLGPLDRLEFRI